MNPKLSTYPEGRQSLARTYSLSNAAGPLCQGYRQPLSKLNIEYFQDETDINPHAHLFFACKDTPLEEVNQQVRQASQGLQAPVFLIFQDRVLAEKEIWQLLESGASEVFQNRKIPECCKRIAAKIERWRKLGQLIRSSFIEQELVGNSAAWKKILWQIVEISHFTQASVLILGESGTGKEMVSKLIHQLDPRPHKQELVIVDCTTIVPELSGSELFGHDKGAFTHAVANRDGAFCLANHGSLFLDEIGELPLVLQAELLRVIQEGTYKRVGSNNWRQTDFRLICATNRDLSTEMQRGLFRPDLFYRISSWIITLPPLRNRREDIPLLTRHFLSQFLTKNNIPEIEAEVISFLVNREYPGNVRELRQLVHRIANKYAGEGPITLADVPETDRPCLQEADDMLENRSFRKILRSSFANGLGLKEIKRLINNMAMEVAIADCEGNLQLAAKRLGVSDRLLQNYNKEMNGR